MARSDIPSVGLKTETEMARVVLEGKVRYQYVGEIRLILEQAIEDQLTEIVQLAGEIQVPLRAALQKLHQENLTSLTDVLKIFRGIEQDLLLDELYPGLVKEDLGARALNGKQLEALLADLDKYQTREGVKEIARKYNLGENLITEAIERKKQLFQTALEILEKEGMRLESGEQEALALDISNDALRMEIENGRKISDDEILRIVEDYGVLNKAEKIIDNISGKYVINLAKFKENLKGEKVTENVKKEIEGLFKGKVSKLNPIIGTVTRQAELEVINIKKNDPAFWSKYSAISEEREIKESFDNYAGSKRLINNFARVVRVFNERETEITESQKTEAMGDIKKMADDGHGDFSPYRAEKAVEDMEMITKVLKMKPKEFGDFFEQYKTAREALKNAGLELPETIKSVRSLENLISVVEKFPELKQYIVAVQKFAGMTEKVGGILTKLGFEKVGTQIASAIGGQAVGEFVKQGAMLIAKEGFEKALVSVLKLALGSGAGAATGGATTAAVGGAAGVVAAFGAIPIAGQIVLVIAVALAGLKVLYDKLVKPIIETIKGGLGMLGINLPSFKKLLGETFGLGKAGEFMGAIPDFFMGVALPFVIAGIGAIGAAFAGAMATATTVLAPIIIGVFVFLFGYSLLGGYEQMGSTMVPSTIGMGGGQPGGGGGIIWDPSIPIPEGCPVGFPVTGGTITQGYLSPQCSHENMENAIDISIGTGTEVRATHNGIVAKGENDLYGSYVVIKGKCGGVEFTTWYAHMIRGSSHEINNMEEIKQGQIIGLVDNTGSSTGSHLHYDIRGLSDPIERYLQFSKSLKGCCIDNGNLCPQR